MGATKPEGTHADGSIPSVAWRHLTRDESRENLSAVLEAERVEAAAVAAMDEPLRAAEKVADAARATRRAIDSIFDPALTSYRCTLIQRHIDLQREEKALRTLAEQRAAAVHAEARKETAAA